jgi:hypothetical protein
VAIDGAAIAVFAIEVSQRSAGELAAAWKAWGEGAVDPLPARSEALR